MTKLFMTLFISLVLNSPMTYSQSNDDSHCQKQEDQQVQSEVDSQEISIFFEAASSNASARR